MHTYTHTGTAVHTYLHTYSHSQVFLLALFFIPSFKLRIKVIILRNTVFFLNLHALVLLWFGLKSLSGINEAKVGETPRWHLAHCFTLSSVTHVSPTVCVLVCLFPPTPHRPTTDCCTRHITASPALLLSRLPPPGGSRLATQRWLWKPTATALVCDVLHLRFNLFWDAMTRLCHPLRGRPTI